jgi:hypothetical protein
MMATTREDTMTEAITLPKGEALRQLRRVVLNAPPKELDMMSWGERTACNTACCALGHAYFDPWFREHTSITDFFTQMRDPLSPRRWRLRDTSPGDIDGDAADLFGIDYSDASRLFMHMTSYARKSRVIRNIDLLLEGKEARSYGRFEEWNAEDEVHPEIMQRISVEIFTAELTPINYDIDQPQPEEPHVQAPE